MAHITLDFSYGEDDLAEALVMSLHTHPGVSYRIEELHGSGGGWPEVKFIGRYDDVRAFVLDAYIGGDEEYLASLIEFG